MIFPKNDKDQQGRIQHPGLGLKEGLLHRRPERPFRGNREHQRPLLWELPRHPVKVNYKSFWKYGSGSETVLVPVGDHKLDHGFLQAGQRNDFSDGAGSMFY